MTPRCFAILVFSGCLVTPQAVDDTLQEIGRQQMAIWAEEAAEKKAHLTKAWQRRAEAILDMISGLEGQQTPIPASTLDNVVKVLGLMNLTLQDTKRDCENDEVKYYTDNKTLWQATWAVPPLVQSAKVPWKLYADCMAQEKTCWDSYCLLGCCQGSPGATTTPAPTTTTATPCNLNSTYRWRIGYDARQFFSCDFSKESPEDCKNKIFQAENCKCGTTGNNITFEACHPPQGFEKTSCDKRTELDEEWERWNKTESECIALNIAQRKAKLDKLNKLTKCEDHYSNCTTIRNTCTPLRTAAKLKLDVLQQAVRKKCEEKRDFLYVPPASPIKGTHPQIRENDLSRENTYEGLWLVRCILQKFVAQQTFKSYFHAECVEARPPYTEGCCDTGSFHRSNQEITSEVEWLATCPSSATLFTVTTYQAKLESEMASIGEAGWLDHLFPFKNITHSMTSNSTGWIHDSNGAAVCEPGAPGASGWWT